MRHNPNTIIASRVSDQLRADIFRDLANGEPIHRVAKKRNVSTKFANKIAKQVIALGLRSNPQRQKTVRSEPKPKAPQQAEFAILTVEANAVSSPDPAPIPAKALPPRRSIMRRKMQAYQQLIALVEEIGELLLPEAQP